MKAKLLVLSFLVTIGLFGCKYEKISGCDTTNVKFSTTIKPILQNHCYTCHGQSQYLTNGNGKNLEIFDSLKIFVNSGQLVKAVNWSDPSNVPTMPQGGPKLADCDIQQVEKWVLDGAPNN